MTTELFNVHAPDLDLQQSMILEASAGTGKTYSIENLVVRALLNPPFFQIDEILVVTFTKIAAQELRLRIHKNIQNAYIKEVDKVKKRYLQHALSHFESACISTIHSFCFQALKEFSLEMAFDLASEQNSQTLAVDLQWQIIENYLRKEAFADSFTTEQIEILLKNNQYQIVNLIREVIRVMQRGLPIAAILPNETLIQKYWSLREKLPKFLSPIIEEHACCFLGMCEGRTKNLKAYFKQSALELDDRLIQIEPVHELLSHFAKNNLKAKSKIPIEIETYLDVLHEIRQILSKLCEYPYLLCRLVAQCQSLINEAIEKEGLYDFNSLLKKTEKLAAEDSNFKDKIRQKYRLAIIDEFQDTDPSQWNIFKKLFADSKTHLILVGDPKQSIYAFRSADVYTYLEAEKALPLAKKFRLATNYRSTLSLVEALNYLFDFRGWLPLPAIGSYLDFYPVEGVLESVEKQKPLTFLFAANENEEKLEDVEEQYFFPAFVTEIHRLIEAHQLSLNEIAFLVRDRLQARRLLEYLGKHGLNAHVQRALTFSQSEIIKDLVYLLKAILHPKNLSDLQIALGSIFFNWDWMRLETLKDQEVQSQIFKHFIYWHNQWEKEGLAKMMTSFFDTSFINEKFSIKEFLLTLHNGQILYHELSQILEWLVALEEQKALAPYALFLELLTIAFDPDSNENLKLESLSSTEAVQILTMHMSKGLEFKAVFALGVINRTPVESGIIPLKEGQGLVLKAISNEEADYRRFLEETDAEKSRQLYVALTRAKYFLYIPVFNYAKNANLGTGAPIELFLKRKMAPQDSWEGLYEAKADFLPLLQDLTHHDSIAFNVLDKNPTLPLKDLKPHKELIAPPMINVTFPVKSSFSFTSLTKFLPKPKFEYTKTENCLPIGSETGILLHELLEEISFAQLQQCSNPSQIYAMINEKIKHTSYEPWGNAITELIYNAFHLPLGEKGFKLADIPSEDLFREMDFLYPSTFIAKGEGELKGIIDLFFRYQDKYYLLDWKSNYLGESKASYQECHLKQAVELNHYRLQADLYIKAIKQYLQKVENRPFKDIFGGMAYLFLRGFDGKNGIIWLYES